MSIFWMSLIALLPALLWGILWWFQDREREPFAAMASCFLLGMLAPLLMKIAAGVLLTLVSGQESWVFLLVMACAEEVVKAVLLILGIELQRQWFTQIVDGLVYGAVVGLGFAFIENIFYLTSASGFDGGFTIVFLIRSVNTMVGHAVFSALFGFFYASAYLNKKVFPKKKREKPWGHFWKNLGEALPFHVTLFHLLPNRPSKHGHYPGSLILEGILVVSLLHFFFNALFDVSIAGHQLGFLTFPLVSVLVYGLWRMFFQSVYVRVIRAVKG